MVLVDERPRTCQAAPASAHARVVVPYEALAEVVAQGPASFAAIMTHAHERDGLAWPPSKSDLGYLGLLGSRAKVAPLVGERTMPDWFHAPMGIPIGSATPAEIAVSIAAEWWRSAAVPAGTPLDDVRASRDSGAAG